MDLRIFDVEHGACSLLTCDNGERLMIDCGHNGTTGWRPGSHLRNVGTNRLDMLAITNYDEDHVSGLLNLRQSVTIGWLWRNKSVTPQHLRLLKSEDGMGPGVEELVSMASEYGSDSPGYPLPVFSGVERQGFHNSPSEFDDENNLSFAVHLKIKDVNFLFPGDLERAGWEALLSGNPAFRTVVRHTSVLIASHHGRESGLYAELFSLYGCNPYYVVISDKGYMYDTQLTCPTYQRYSRGGPFRGEQRWVLTTRNDGAIRFWFENGKWGAS